MVKRFRQNKAVWLSYGTFLLQQGQSDAASALLQRALKSLPSKESKMACLNTEDLMPPDSLVYICIFDLYTHYWPKAARSHPLKLCYVRETILFPCPSWASPQVLTFTCCHASSQVWMSSASLLSWSSVMVMQRKVAPCLTKSWRATRNAQTSGPSSSTSWLDMDRRRTPGELALLSSTVWLIPLTSVFINGWVNMQSQIK